MKHIRKCPWLIAMLSISAAGAVVANQANDAKNKILPNSDLEALQGKWQAVQMIWGGDRIPAESLTKLQLVITKQWYAPDRGPIKWLERGNHLVEAQLPERDGALQIDPTTEPKTIVVYPPQRNLAFHGPLRGIYKLEGDILTVCFGGFGEPPLNFDDKNALQFAVYKRVPAASDEDIKSRRDK